MVGKAEFSSTIEFEALLIPQRSCLRLKAGADEGGLPGHQSQQHVEVLDLVLRDAQVVLVKHDQVGPFSRLQGA